MDDDDARVLAGIDVGGTTTQAILVGSDLRILARSEASTPALESGVAMAATAASLVRSLADGRSVLGVGVGAAGVVDTNEGRILVASDSFGGWSGFRWPPCCPKHSARRRLSTTTSTLSCEAKSVRGQSRGARRPRHHIGYRGRWGDLDRRSAL